MTIISHVFKKQKINNLIPNSILSTVLVPTRDSSDLCYNFCKLKIKFASLTSNLERERNTHTLDYIFIISHHKQTKPLEKKKRMATHWFSHILSFFLATLWFFFTTSSTTIQVTIADATRNVVKPSELVDGVCKKTSNYSFCVESLYADSRTARADSYGLAFVVFGMSYRNATGTQDLIAQLTKKANRGGQRDQPLLTRLQRCSSDYKKAVSALLMAYNDLNSETFFELADMANVASKSAEDCQAGFQKSKYSPLTIRNHVLKGLCEICVVVSKLFTGGN